VRGCGLFLRWQLSTGVAPRVDFEELADGHFGVDRGCFEFFVAEQLLDKPDVGAAFEHVRGTGVTQKGQLPRLARPARVIQVVTMPETTSGLKPILFI
jgi:hypothetical protein